MLTTPLTLLETAHNYRKSLHTQNLQTRIRGVFRALLNIYDKTFCQNCLQLKAVRDCLQIFLLILLILSELGRILIPLKSSEEIEVNLFA